MAKYVMINPDAVALASFPRSGNTFLRLVLYDCFSHPSWSVYGKEHFLEHRYPTSVMSMQSKTALFIKTHYLREEHLNSSGPINFTRAIHVVRDPREAINSLSHYAFTAGKFIKDNRRKFTAQEWKDQYLEKQTGRWCRMVDSWVDSPTVALIRFEDLIRYPIEVVGGALEKLDFPFVATGKEPSTFGDLQKTSGKFFRKGKTDSWKSELSVEEIAKIEKICSDRVEKFEY